MQLLLSVVSPSPRLLAVPGNRQDGRGPHHNWHGWVQNLGQLGQGQSPAWVLSPTGKQPWEGARSTPRPSVGAPEPEHPNGDASSCTEPG